LNYAEFAPEAPAGIKPFHAAARRAASYPRSTDWHCA